MPELRITLSDAKMQQLRTMAERLGVPVEELARAQVESLLAPLDEDFLHAAEYVLKKNEELYRRLAASNDARGVVADTCRDEAIDNERGGFPTVPVNLHI